MRRTFFSELFGLMGVNPNVVVVTGDLGYGGFDKIMNSFPKRFFNTGASEQAMMGVATGLALTGKTVFVYSITPFLLYRPFETIRNYINHEQIPVIMVGSGRDFDYSHDGFSHHAHDVDSIMCNFKNINSYFPYNKSEIHSILEKVIVSNKPSFISLKR